MCHMRGKWAQRLLFVWEHRCGYCRREIERRNFTVDHFIPRAHGGKNQLENWVPVCGKCNVSKDSHEPYVWMRACEINVTAFDERRERWCTYVYETMKKAGHYAEGHETSAPMGPLTFKLAIPRAWPPGSSDSG